MPGVMQGKVCIVTGATSGVGEAAAVELARMGAVVVLISRNPEKCARVTAAIRDKTGNSSVDFIPADLSSQVEVRQAAAAFRQRYSRLDVLVNNAGSVFMQRELSLDGIEKTFALNHLSYFLLTNLLLDLLQTSRPARVVNVSSGAHYAQKLNFNDLQLEKWYGVFRAYGKSKLANVLFTYELARRMDGQGVTVNAMTPGMVATNIWSHSGIFARFINLPIRWFGQTSEEGARTIVYLASSPEVEGVTGRFFVNQRPMPSSPESRSDEKARRLWEVSAQMTGWNAQGGQDG